MVKQLTISILILTFLQGCSSLQQQERNAYDKVICMKNCRIEKLEVLANNCSKNIEAIELNFADMKYSKYFYDQVANNQLKIDGYQMNRMLQIISIEGSIQALLLQKDKVKIKEKSHYYDMDIYSYKTELTNLTGNLQPEELLKEMVSLSH